MVEDDAAGPQLVSRGKLDALADILQDYVVDGKKKLVIFARFIPEVMEIIKLADGMIGKRGMRIAAIYGATTVFVGQIDTAGTGITLTAADTCVYYSENFNYATYEQSLSRIHRIGQRHPCTYIHLVAEKTVDELILKSLAAKEDLAKTIVDDWRRFLG